MFEDVALLVINKKQFLNKCSAVFVTLGGHYIIYSIYTAWRVLPVTACHVWELKNRGGTLRDQTKGAKTTPVFSSIPVLLTLLLLSSVFLAQ